jgi:protein-S-isoprenylcysteine O-methyltransferase Ste14
MIDADPYLLVRAASIYLAVVLTALVWIWRRPAPRALAGGLLASIWNLPALLILNIVAERLEWWRFDTEGGLLIGIPVDLFLSWAWLWGAIPALALPRINLPVVLVLALGVDLVLMPAASPVLKLGPFWLLGETAGLLTALLPAQLLARWTTRRERLGRRAALQAIAFGGLVFFVLPAVAIEGSRTSWLNPLTRPIWQLSLIFQALAVPGVLGLTAVQEFAFRGGGTPVPFDPPGRLVTSGVYAYIRNPMQLSAVILLILIGLVLHNFWVSAAGVMAHLYSIGFAGWDEDEDLQRRFGDRWTAYRAGVARWIPLFRPSHAAESPPARLYVAENCEVCRGVRQWLEQRHPLHLEIVAAECHPSSSLTRITYQAGDSEDSARGVEALARALEHIHLGWALLGWFLRLPGICQLAQVLVDASGGQPRTIVRSATSQPSK